MKYILTIFFSIFSCFISFGQEKIPENSPIFKTCGTWEIVSGDIDRRISCIYSSNGNVIVQTFHDIEILRDSSTNILLPSDYYLTEKFLYTTFLKEYNLYLTRVYFGNDNNSAYLSTYFDDIRYSCFGSKDDIDLIQYPLEFNSEPVKINCRKTLIEPDIMQSKTKLEDNKDVCLEYRRIDIKIDENFLLQNDLNALFYDSLKQQIPSIKTYKDLYLYFTELAADSPFFSIKEKILSASDLISKLNGNWTYKSKDSVAECRFETINKSNSFLLFLADTINSDVDLFFSKISLNWYSLSPNPGPRNIIKIAKFKIPYQYISYDFLLGNISLSRGYEYIVKDGDYYYYLKDRSNFLLKSKFKNEYIFEGWRLHKTEDGKIRREVVQLKWMINSGHNKIDEFVNFGSGWIHCAIISRD